MRRDLLAEWNGSIDIASYIERKRGFRYFNYYSAVFDDSLPDGDSLRLGKALATMSERLAIRA